LISWKTLVAFAATGLCTTARANDPGAVPSPVFAAGDRWVFNRTIEKGTNGFGQRLEDMVVERLGNGTMVVGLKPDGSLGGFEDHVAGADWSQRRVAYGEEMVTTRPLTFPLRVGKSWTVDYTDTKRRGAQLSDHVHRTCTVVGWGDVPVPAGTFRAIKVQANGVDEAIIDVPTTAVGAAAVQGGAAMSTTRTQRGALGRLTRATYAEFYYVPQTKNFVKAIEEQYDTGNVRVRSTMVLVSFKPMA
jgi:hypothetical protein